MRSSAWNQYLISPEFQQQFQVDRSGYYSPPAYTHEYKRYHCHCGSDQQNFSSFEPLIEYPYSDDITFIPIEVGSNSGISGKSDANSMAISNSDGASVCPTSIVTREKSKNAARMRRSNENCEYKELSYYLPLPSDEKVMLDKASSIRLTTNFLKMRALLSSNQRSDRIIMPKQTCLSTALENWEITGTKFLDIVKNEDQEEFLQNLRLTPWEESEMDCINKGTLLICLLTMITFSLLDYSFMRRFVIRVKCLLSKSRNSLSCEGYKAMHFEGHIKATIVHSNDTLIKQVQYLIGVAQTLPVANRISMEVKLSRDMFMFRAGLDLKLSYVDDQIECLTGHQPKNIMEKSLYDLIHCGDAEEVVEGHKTHKGQAIFKMFRLLCLNGGWIWVQAYAIVLRGSRVSKPDFIVGFANVLTGIQAATMKFGVCQLRIESEKLYDDEIVPNKVRRKRRCPVSELDDDNTQESYSTGEAIFTDRFTPGSDYYSSNNRIMNSDLAHYHVAHDPATSKQRMNKDRAYFKERSDGGGANVVSLPPSFVVHTFMEQLSANTPATSNSHENWLYPLYFHQQY
ncbi:unnamed protein product [Hymenolepis diminuta]|uniref:BHLH domain-containing protein n=1 Tax=Hymenolepis diminuta TaxID=6216 RepID=A0A0R3SBH3_HYMDI|nr:unnamed protein product [Hymenolepis diminuta]